MKAINISIHNFRSILDVNINLNDYSFLVGTNNSGKSNIIDAIRIFYEKDLKFDNQEDFPKMATSDKESWMEIEYRPSASELKTLKPEYRLTSNTFKLRKYFQSSNKEGIFAYVGNKLSDSRFYGYKNVQKAKLGDIVYIPSVSKIDEHTKLTGPSVLRDLINTVMKRIIDKSAAYKSLKISFDEFEKSIKTETTDDGLSLKFIEQEITQKIEDWGASFELTVNPVLPDDMVKSLIGHQLHDVGLDQPMSSSYYGQGFQRHLIFTLIRLAARLAAPAVESEKQDFSPNMTWILFEEPEAFLHPSQIDILNEDLRTLSKAPETQVLISTHNPQFVSRNIEELISVIRLTKTSNVTNIYQINNVILDSILNQNLQDLPQWQMAGLPIDPADLTLDMEGLKYSLWLDPRRCSSFFANKVLLVEGPTETALINYLEDSGYLTWRHEGLFVLDTMGKYNIHRFMNLFGALGIPHYVLYDQDNGRCQVVENTISSCSNSYTKGIDHFINDIEDFLGIQKASRQHRKPQHVLYSVKCGACSQQKLTDLAIKINDLVNA